MRTKKSLIVSLAVSLFLFALVAGCSKNTKRPINQSKPIQSNWGKSHKGIRAMLYTPKSDWKVGEVIELRVKIKNTSKYPYLFKKEPYKTINMSHNGEPYADEIGNDPAIASKDIIIKPSETIDLLLTHVKTERKFDIGGAGVYRFGGLGELQFSDLKVLVR